MNRQRYALAIVALILSSTALCRAQEKPEITVRYDRFEDRSLVKLTPINLAISATEGLAIGAAFGYQGSTPLQTESAVLYFQSLAANLKYRNNQTLILLVDGERLARTADRYKEGIYEGMAAEDLYFDIDDKTLMRIASAKKVEGRLGQKEFELPKGVLEGLKELARRMKQQ
jgi:hypothetical protein